MPVNMKLLNGKLLLLERDLKKHNLPIVLQTTPKTGFSERGFQTPFVH